MANLYLIELLRRILKSIREKERVVEEFYNQ